MLEEMDAEFGIGNLVETEFDMESSVSVCIVFVVSSDYEIENRFWLILLSVICCCCVPRVFDFCANW